jgi:hypothetical protein
MNTILKNGALDNYQSGYMQGLSDALMPTHKRNWLQGFNRKELREKLNLLQLNDALKILMQFEDIVNEELEARKTTSFM